VTAFGTAAEATAKSKAAFSASLKRGLEVTIVLVTHELPSILRVADQCIMLDRDAAGIIARGAPRALAERSTDERVLAFFRRQPLPRLQGSS
jgi:phospholipid/cholesterol/gamma-HCH transport system ATP-binding protein